MCDMHLPLGRLVVKNLVCKTIWAIIIDYIWLIKSIIKMIIKWAILDSECKDNLPLDYGAGTMDYGKCGYGWKCSDWAGKGPKGTGISYCHDNWSSYRNCVPKSTGMIKDYCKISCDVCGKLLIYYS